MAASAKEQAANNLLLNRLDVEVAALARVVHEQAGREIGREEARKQLDREDRRQR